MDDIIVAMFSGDSDESEILNKLVEECDDMLALGAVSCFTWRNFN